MDTKIQASIISGMAEVFTTYPIDYLKTIRQSNKPMDLFWTNPYRGSMVRLVGLVPMRMIFWNSIYYCNDKGYSNFKTSIMASSLQTILDYPIEQIKIQKMIHNRPLCDCIKIKTLLPGFTTTLTRNFGFLYIMNYCITMEPDNKYNSAIGGLLGSLLTHPLDTLKTHYQHNTTATFPNFTIRQYFNGGLYRCSINLISMGVGWNIYKLLVG
jgi:hypothetical protein